MQSSSLFAVVIAALAVAVLLPESANGSLARGFNENIEWQSLSDGLAAAKSADKPVMFLLHKSWCGACKRLKEEFKNQELESLSQQFVMVNLEDDEHPTDPAFSPDGQYIPRIFFAGPDGQIRNDIYNRAGSDKYKYYYPSSAQIVSAMKEAASVFSNLKKN